MAVKIRTVVTYNLDGATTTFTIPFEYLARKFVTVTLIGQDRKELVLNQDYRFSSKTQITTTVAWGTGSGYQLIEIRRFTSATERLVDFSDGSILRAYDLNISQVQTLHVAEEARDLTADTIGVNNDGHLDARGRRIVNLADPKDPLDAVNLRTIQSWNDGAYQSYIKAKEEADKAARSASAAKTSETNANSHMVSAKTSETNAKASETQAANSKNAAAGSASSAATSASSAATSAKEATDAKAYTKQQADRSYSEAERAKGYADSMGNTIDVGKVIDTIKPDTGYVVWKGEHQFVARVGVSDGLPGAYTARVYMTAEKGKPQLGTYDGTTWRLFDMPLENNGRIATREYLHNRLIFAFNNTYIKSPGEGKAVILVDDNNAGIYGGSNNNQWLFRVNQEGNSYTFGELSVGRALTVRSASNQNDTAGLYMGGGRGFISQYIAGKWTGELTLPQASGTLATQQWCNSQNFGTRLSGLIRGSAVRVESNDGTLKATWLADAFQQVPNGAVFCGFDRGTSGSYVALTPKWRTVS